MFVDTAYQVIRKARVQNTRSVRHDVYKVLVARHALTQRSVQTLRSAQGDTYKGPLLGTMGNTKR
jgi:hypothetical protein